MGELLEEARQLFSYTVTVRRHLHENPELTSKEFETVKYIIGELQREQIPYQNIPDGGILAWLDGEKDGQAVLLRADCDALPILESEKNVLYPKVCVSKRPGIAHACGHDAHVAMLLTAVRILKKRRAQIEGRIYFLFERGEEGGNCIYYVMKEIQRQGLSIDACYGLHTDTGIPVGKFAGRTGTTNSGNVNFEIQLIGKNGHGSRPDRANNPIDCFLTLGNALKDLRMKYVSPDSPITYTIGKVQSGEKRNIVPESLTFLGTVRFHERSAGLRFKEKMKDMIEDISHAYDCTARFVEFTGPSFPVYNEPETTAVGIEAAALLVGPENVTKTQVGMGSESFATLAAFYPSSFMRVGVRNEEKGITASGHRPDFDLDEEGMIYGSALYAQLGLLYLSRKRRAPEGFVPFEGSIDDFLAETHRPVPKRYDCE